jgi:hypothetical protein
MLVGYSKPIRGSFKTEEKSFRNSLQYLDTAQLIKDNIIAHQREFQHQELNKTIMQLPLTVKSYNYLRGAKPGAAIVGLLLSFEDASIVHSKALNGIYVPSLLVYFETGLPRAEVLALRQKNDGAWTKDEVEYYGKQLIKDVDVSRKIAGNHP